MSKQLQHGCAQDGIDAAYTTYMQALQAELEGAYDLTRGELDTWSQPMQIPSRPLSNVLATRGGTRWE
eukprot:1568968-Prorocentrum_lima.AAC.1